MKLRSLRCVFFAFALSGALVAAGPTHAEDDASLSGTVKFSIPGISIAEVAPVVVFLEAIDAPAARRVQNESVVHQRNARFSPRFQVVSVGDRVRMVNDDQIFHNVFSFSKPNDFDLGTYPAGQSRVVTFEHPGVVRTYCSIHESMNATIFVAPTPYYAVAAKSGSFAIRPVPAGRYRVRAWSERLPLVERQIELVPGEDQRLDVQMAPHPN